MAPRAPAGAPAPLLLGAALLLVPAHLPASVTFGSGQTVRGGLDGAQLVHAGDLDGDGDTDLVGIGGGRVVYALNDGDGASWTSTDLANGSRLRQIELADLDGDTDLDVVYTDFDEDRAYWFRNNLDTSGSFAARRTVASASGADGVVAADLDGDTDLDLVVTARSGDAYYWIENGDGNGTSWTRHLLADRLDAPQTVAIGDLDGDGDPDIVGGGSEDEGRLVWLENSAGDATEWSVRELDLAWVSSVAIVDMDLDGDEDIVLQENDAAPPASDADIVLWWENTAGDASAWSEHRIGPTGRDATRGLQMVDLDFDGDPDVVASRDGDWFENTAGDATAWTQHSYSNGDEIVDTDVDDFDGDGDLDVVGARLGRDRIEWWENLTCSLADPDDDSDGFRNACDVCDGFDDALDDDGDGVPDGCDRCPGEDDRVDLDGEGTPDACQVTGSLSIDDVTASEGDAAA
ncbi:MAG: VCBS repeat-containing protein, partial [Holophagales bacterium]|nr:VCBS repeat-containing protein [Holophagales bacterium]